MRRAVPCLPSRSAWRPPERLACREQRPRRCKKHPCGSNGSLTIHIFARSHGLYHDDAAGCLALLVLEWHNSVHSIGHGVTSHPECYELAPSVCGASTAKPSRAAASRDGIGSAAWISSARTRPAAWRNGASSPAIQWVAASIHASARSTELRPRRGCPLPSLAT